MFMKMRWFTELNTLKKFIKSNEHIFSSNKVFKDFSSNKMIWTSQIYKGNCGATGRLKAELVIQMV